MITKYEFEKLLDNMHLSRLNLDTQQVLYGHFCAHRMEYADAYAFLNGAKKRAIVSSDNEQWVRLNIIDLVQNHSNSADIELYKRIDEIDKKFKEFYRNNKIKATQTDNVFKTVRRAIKKQNDTFNRDLCDFTKEELDMIYNVACIYNSLNNTFGVNGLHEADKIITLGFAKSIENNKSLNKKLQRDNKFATNVDELLKSLTTANNELSVDEQFQPDEVKQLFTQTVCLLYTTNKLKADQTRKILRNYLDDLLELAKDRPEEKEFLSKVTAKSLILRAGSILMPAPTAIQESLELLMGKRAGELSLQESSRDQKNQEICKLYPNLHIEGFDLDKHLYMLQKRVTLIPKLSLQALATAQNQIIDGLAGGLIKNADKLSLQERTARLAKLGIKTDSLIHADNLSELVLANPFKKSEKQINFSQNINLFSKVLPVSDLQKLVCHNVALLCQPTSFVEGKINEIVNKNKKDMRKCKKELEQFVNSKFTLTEGVPYKTTRENDNLDEPDIEIEEFDVDDNKDYIDLNLSKLRAQVIDAKQNIHTPYVDTITAENYENMLYQELLTLSAYLDSKENLNKLNLAPDSLGGILSKINSGKAPQGINGAMKTKLLGIKKMMDYLNDTTSKKDGAERGVSIVKDKIDNRLSVLKSEIESTTTLADEMFLSDYTRNIDNDELINEYRQVLTLTRKTMEVTRSKTLLKSLMEDCEFYESKIEELAKQHKKVGSDRSDYRGFYADRANLLTEQQFLLDISNLLNEALAKKSDKKLSGKIEQSFEMPDKEKIEALKKIIEKRQRWYDDKYKNEQSRNGSHAKKVKTKIDGLKKELDRLESVNGNE